MPQPHRGDYSLYAGPSADCQRSLGVFVRIMDAPGGRYFVYLGMHA